jgi:hypothetical protein
MMNSRTFVMCSLAVILIVLLSSAGCTSIPGPEPRQTLIPVTTMPVEVVTMRTSTLMATPAPTTAALATAPIISMTPTSSLQNAATGLKTCSRQGGGIAEAGQQCPGTWLVASDTFNCCSKAPVREISRNASVTISPFDVVIVMDDDPGNTLP